jgi:hypothetical protein
MLHPLSSLTEDTRQKREETDMTTKKLLLTLLLAAWSLLQLSGCSLIGFGLGSSIDAKSPDEYVFTPSGADSIKKGATVEVLRTDGSMVSGKFERLEALESEKYTVRYQQFTNSAPIGKQMPALGNSIVIVKQEESGRKELRGIFLGFEKERIRIHMTVWSRPATLYVHAGDTLLSSGTETIDGDVLRQHMRKGDIPYMTAIVISNRQGAQELYLDDIIRIRQSVSKKAKWLGLAMGAAVDVYLAANAEFEIFSGTRWK